MCCKRRGHHPVRRWTGSRDAQGADKGALLVGALDPARRREAIEAYASAGLEAYAMEWMPRITRAQSMDILSSQSNLAGYKAVVDAAAIYGRAFPMMMTAAGTISPTKAFVMGVGVAGLQAIATARRLGAQVSATDVRSATSEQIQSLGAKPIFVDDVAGIEGEGSGGYATEMSEEYQQSPGRAGVRAHRQAGHRHHHRLDPRPAGAAADQRRTDRDHASRKRDRRPGGRGRRQCRGHRRRPIGREARRHVVGAANLARSLPADASALFARNLYNFLSAFWDKEQGRPVLPDDDEIVKGDAPDEGRQGRERAARARGLSVARSSDILVIGGGIAGLSAAAELSRSASVAVLEAEAQIGFHSSGRSATMVHYALGDAVVRALTLASRPFFDSPPDGFTDVPLGRTMPVLVYAREDERDALDRLEGEIARFAEIERLDARGVHQLCPLLNG